MLSELQFVGRSLNIGGYDSQNDVPPGSGIRTNFTGVIQRVGLRTISITSVLFFRGFHI